MGSGARVTEIPFDRIRSWMFDAALPFWAARGVDAEHGGFLEELHFDGRPTAADFKRVRTLCRQTYVFSHAALLGWERGAELSRLGYEYLAKHAWLGSDRGWARLLSRQGAVIDATPDLYDLAFVLYALAWRYRLSGDKSVRAKISQTLEFIERHMRDGEFGGYWHQLPPTGWRVQNPHMHLLEALLVLEQSTGEGAFLVQIELLVDLFQSKFFNGETLCESFEHDWTIAAGNAGRVVEPGHQFEWAWILAQYQKLGRRNVRSEIEALVTFAEAHGVDPVRGAVYDALSSDGVVLQSSSRTWPNTERIKGHLACFEMGGNYPVQAAQAARLLLDCYLATAPVGTWVDKFGADGNRMASKVPASTLYHVFLSFSEMLRLQEDLERRAKENGKFSEGLAG